MLKVVAGLKLICVPLSGSPKYVFVGTFIVCAETLVTRNVRMVKAKRVIRICFVLALHFTRVSLNHAF